MASDVSGSSSSGARAKALLDRGLEKYARGDLLGAINEWEHALSIDRTLHRASEYIDYVRDNFDLLAEQFAEAHAVEDAAAEAGVPVTEAEDDPDAYDSIELTSPGEERTPIPEPRLTMRGPPNVVAPRRADESAAPLPPPPAEMPGLHVGDLDLGELPDAVSSSGEEPAPLTHELELDQPDPSGTQDTTMSRGRQTRREPETYGGPTSVLTIRPKGHGPEDLPAPPMSASPPILDLDLGPPLDAGSVDEPLPPTEEPFSLVDDDSHEAEHTRPRARSGGPTFGEEAPTFARHAAPDLDEPALEHEPSGPPAVIIDDPFLSRQQQSTTPMPRPPPPPPEEEPDESEPQHGLAPEASEGDRIRRRVNEHLHQAMLAAEVGDFGRAVLEAEEAGAADPDGLIAPVIMARHRDFLHRVYEGHLGDTSRVPLVAVPLHEISAQSLDHRTGFLLSRIDGMLTFEDILDIAGMPRIEAYRILSQLLRKGFIEVR